MTYIFLLFFYQQIMTSNCINLDKLVSQFISSDFINNRIQSYQHGKFRFWKTTDCLSILHKPSPFTTYDGCYLQNPDAPYGLIMLPPHKDEMIDKYFGFPVLEGDLSATWHLNPNEAILLLGITPPECKYFSFSNYLYSRFTDSDWLPNSSIPKYKHMCPPGSESERCEIFASLDDSINLDRGLNLPSEKFNSFFALIISPSIKATNIIQQGLRMINIPATVISNYSYPGKHLNLGIESKDDTFLTIMRTAFYKNITQANQYFNEIPFKVLRLEFSSKYSNLFDKKPLVKRDYGQHDATIINQSLDYMKNVQYILVEQVIRNVTEKSKNLKNNWSLQIAYTQSGVPENGFECINNGQRCLGDCRDTIYPVNSETYNIASICNRLQNLNHTGIISCDGTSDGLLTDNSDDKYIVVGVNHAKTQMARYSSLSVYDSKYLWGVYTIGNDDLENTVNAYIQHQVLHDPDIAQATPYMYIYEIRRDCENINNCITIPSTFNKNIPFIPYDDVVIIAERMYNNPVTHVGPDKDSVILPIVLHFRRKS